MNAGATSSSARSEPAKHASPERSESEKDRCAQDFERALRDKGGWPEDDMAGGDGGQDSHEDPSSAAPPPTQLPMQLPPGAFAMPATGAQAQAQVVAMPASPRMPVEAIRAAELDASLPPPGDAGRGFEVSVNERMGVPLSLQVMPPGAVHPGGGWTLSISSPNLNPATLKRYSGRLEERLRSRSLTSEPVHIDHEDEA